MDVANSSKSSLGSRFSARLWEAQRFDTLDVAWAALHKLIAQDRDVIARLITELEREHRENVQKAQAARETEQEALDNATMRQCGNADSQLQSSERDEEARVKTPKLRRDRAQEACDNAKRQETSCRASSTHNTAVPVSPVSVPVPGAAALPWFPSGIAFAADDSAAAPPTVRSTTEPPTALPGGYTVGDEVFFTGVSKTWENGNRLVYGGKGEVTSPATEATEGKGDLDVILMKGYV